MASKPLDEYQKTAVITASKEKILLMLYQGAIRFVRQAIKALDDNNIAKKGESISKATAILSELLSTLDFKVSDEIASELERLYLFMIDKLIDGNIKNCKKSFEDVEKILETLYKAWEDIVENPRKDGVPSPKLQKKEYEAYAAGNQSEEQEKSPRKDKKVKIKLLT